MIHQRWWATFAQVAQPRLQCRLASTASSSTGESFSFPTHSKPSPHEIFHLPYGCSQKEIKARYYDLVRQHHPDSPSCRLIPSAKRHARFQAITAAYDSLRKGKLSSNLANASMFDDYAEEIAKRKHMYYKHQHGRHYGPHRSSRETPGYAPRFEWDSNPDDRWKDHMIIAFGFVSLALGIAPGLFLFPKHMKQRHNDAVMNLSQAELEAREIGEQRRIEMKNRLKGLKSQSSSQGSSPADLKPEPD